MDKDWKVQTLFPRFVLMYLNNGLNKKRRKTDGTISDESIQKDTPIYKNSMHMGDGKDVVTCYPKEKIIELS